MSAQPLKLAPISNATAAVINRFGAGAKLEFNVKDVQGSLTLTAASERSAIPNERWQTPKGVVALSDVFGFIQLLTPLPLISEDVQENALYWCLALSHVCSELRPMLGGFEPSDAPLEFACVLNWQIELEGHCKTGTLWLGADTLDYWLEQGEWQYIKPELPKMLRLSMPLVLGRLDLFCRAFKALCPGDVVLGQQALFDTQGAGQLHLGKRQLRVQWQSGSDYQITDIVETKMSDSTLDEYIEHEPQDELASFDEVEMHFTIEAGQISLPLKQLRSLAVGAILTADGMTPGQAVLRHRNMIVGRGQLVDVEGRLGLQLHSVEVGHAD